MTTQTAADVHLDKISSDQAHICMLNMLNSFPCVCTYMFACGFSFSSPPPSPPIFIYNLKAIKMGKYLKLS